MGLPCMCISRNLIKGKKMVQVELTGIEKGTEQLSERYLAFRRQMQELEEIKSALKHQGDLEEFVPAIAKIEQTMEQEANALRHMMTALKEVRHYYEQCESRILQEYEQERVAFVRCVPELTRLDNSWLGTLGAAIRF